MKAQTSKNGVSRYSVGRIIDVRQQRVRRRRFRLVVQIAQKAFDPGASVPSHHCGRNFVAQREQHRRGMRRQPTNAVADRPADLALVRAPIQKRDVLHPGHADDDAQAATGRLVEHRGRGSRISPHGVGFQLGDRLEVPGDTRQPGKLVPIRVRCERPVTDALDQKLLSGKSEELA